MSHEISRRAFVRAASTTAAAGAYVFGTLGTARAAEEAATRRIVVGVMGVAGRGADLARGFARTPGVVVKYLCDVDAAVIAKPLAAATTQPAGAVLGSKPEGVADFRRILDDKEVDALVVAAPDHWHAPATILACSAGKHVYVEKPCSHNAAEGEMAVAAARKHDRVVLQGTQRRSWPKVIEAVEKVRAGAIGNVHFARGWYAAARTTIGKGKEVPVPANLNYDLWQGPAPRRPYRDNMIHYKWHWFWHWGSGELGNNGVHSIDVCRWALGVDYPKRVTAGGARYHFAGDDQETPDTMATTFDFGDKMIAWEGRSCAPGALDGTGYGMAFHGEAGSIIVLENGYVQYDAKNKEVLKVPDVRGSGGDAGHLRHFADCVRGLAKPNADIAEAHKSTLLCHLGNIAWRSGQTINCDPKTGRMVGAGKEADALWGREYEKGWEPKV